MKVKSTVSEISVIVCIIRVKNLDELKNLLRAGARFLCNKLGVITKKKYVKSRIGKGELKIIFQDPGKL